MSCSLAITTILALALNLVQAQSQNETDPYAPVYVDCPRNLTVRAASQGLSPSEKSWREQRGQQVISSLDYYLKSANISGLNVSSYLEQLNVSNAPIIGMSISGGGTQSGVGGLGIWEAFDNRSSAANQARTGGIVQVLTYLSGLSGGGALTVSTIAANNFSTVDNIRHAVNFSVDYTVGPDGNQTEYFTNIFENVGAKAEAGFSISVTDAFGQFWGNYLPEQAMYSTFSDINSSGNPFMYGKAPMPIVTLAEVVPGKSPEIGNILYPGFNGTNNFNLTSYEVTPFEFGSWLGGRVQAFMPTEWLGTSMSNGTAQNSSQCAQNFDQFMFIQGSTANAFDAWFIDAWYGIPVFAKRMLEERQSQGGNITIPADQDDSPLVQLVNSTATYFMQTFNQSMWATYPNPFQDYNREMQDVDELLLVDGSLTGETNPIRPLIVPERGVDLVIVYEASSDAKYSWVNGTNLISEQSVQTGRFGEFADEDRPLDSALAAHQGNIPFPEIPIVQTMVTQKLTKQPTFFGCNDSTSTPLVLYLPNSPWSGYSNFSYTKSSFTDIQFNLTVENAFNIATYGNGTIDAEWPECLACAVIWKSLGRMGVKAPQQCTQCFMRHCWSGNSSTASITPAELDPVPRLNPNLTYAEYNKTWYQGSSGR